MHIYTVADCYLSSFSLFLLPIPRPPLAADNIPHSTPLILQQGFLVYINFRGWHPNLRYGFLIYINLRRRHLNPPRPRFVAKNSSILFRPASLIEPTLKTSSDLSPSSTPIRMRQWSCSAMRGWKWHRVLAKIYKIVLMDGIGVDRRNARQMHRTIEKGQTHITILFRVSALSMKHW